MPVTRRAAAAATMADHAAAADAAGYEAMEINTHVARVIQVELAKTKTRVPTRDIINASRILGDSRELLQLIVFLTKLRELIPGIYWTPSLEAWILRQFPPESDAGMAYRGLTADNSPVSREVAPGVSISTIFADIDNFQSKLVACYYSNMHGVIMRYATALRIAPNHPHLPGTAIKLAQSPNTCGAPSTCSRYIVVLPMPVDGQGDLHRPLSNLELPTVEQLAEAVTATISLRTNTPRSCTTHNG
eukprot:jgi/Tetstr1/421040/TSEL_012085.t1